VRHGDIDTLAPSGRETGVEATVHSSEVGQDPAREPAAGSSVGRYVVLSRLGSGAMGVVLAAYDPELDRKVALKLLKSRPGRDQEAARGRLQREAQALAKLNHAHVVAVHDVGIHAGRVFLAMEYVQGSTLSEWMTNDGKGSRSWQEVVRVFEAAGRGLAAAHRVGLIHRDFKPDNVMIGADGRVRVMDFGLARSDETPGTLAAGEEALPGAGPSALDTPLTRTGAVMGTPAYMSPEQFAGTETTVSSDQFGYCVALFEALHGTRPFAGTTVAQLALSVTEGRVVSAPSTTVPAWLNTLVRRGLSVDPSARFPDMEGLLDALAKGETRQRMRRLGLAGVVAAGLAAAGWGAHRVDVKRTAMECEAKGRALDEEAWSPAIQEELRAGLLATGVEYADETVQRVMPWLNRQADAWGRARTEVCLDEDLRRRGSASLHRRARWCLDEHRFAFEALVGELSGSDAQSIQHAVTSAARLAPVNECRDPATMRRRPDPPANPEPIRDVRRGLARADAMSRAGRYEPGLALAEKAVADAAKVGWAPLEVSARATVGSLLRRAGRYEDAESSLENAYFEAAELGLDDLAADLAVALVGTVGEHGGNPEGGKRWARHADLALAGVAEPEDGVRRATLANELGAAHQAAGEYDAAKRLHERAASIHTRVLGDEHPAVGTSLANLATAHQATGDYDEARRVHERALAIRRAALGPRHPYVAMSLNDLATTQQMAGNSEEALRLHGRALQLKREVLSADHPSIAASLANLADTHQTMGHFDEAQELHERALSMRERTLGPEHPLVATSLNNLGTLYGGAGELHRAVGAFERVIEIREKTLGPEHPDLAATLNNLGRVRKDRGEWVEAERLFERALVLWEKALGPEHPSIAVGLGNLASLQRDRGDLEPAKQLYERALAIDEKALGADHPDVAYDLAGLVTVSLRAGRPAEAIAPAERALRLREAGGVADGLIAEVRFGLARALWDAPVPTSGPETGGEPARGRDRTRAHALAMTARDEFAGAGASESKRLAEVDAWLAEHTRP
jgi:tetratricopeptide (TPR) repeat protein/predicted Ser/Thr protein kinase